MAATEQEIAEAFRAMPEWRKQKLAQLLLDIARTPVAKKPIAVPAKPGSIIVSAPEKKAT